MDRFQEDVFDVFRYARTVSRTDSQLFEDSVDLQKFFIQTRDLLCKNGEVLLTPALSYQEVHLLRDVEVRVTCASGRTRCNEMGRHGMARHVCLAISGWT